MLISIVNSFLLLHAAFGLPSNLYLGVGYNILKANPDGGDWSSLGQDPGLLVTRNILETAAGGQHYIKSTNYPQCSSALSTWVFYDPKTYQEYLRHYVTIDELRVSNVSLYAFSESQLYQDIKRKTFSQHDVFRDEISACPSLHARYTVPVVPIHKNLVTPEFARDVCRLPASYNLQAYKHFLDNWGTHVTTEVEMGQKSATRYRLSVANLAEILLNSHESNVASMLVEDFQGYGSVVHLNMSHIQHSDFSRLPLGTKISHFTIGTVTEAILSWTITPIFQVFSNDYWQNLDEFYRNGICDGDTMNLSQLKENFVKALNDYPIASGGEKPPSVDMKLPITWPSGAYGLYMPKTGCPKDPSDFSTGYFTSDTEDFKNQNNWTTGIHLNGTFDHGAITTYFCMKIRPTFNEYNRTWPAGNYCILKKGDCPTGFLPGALIMDDEDDNNGNAHVGALPDGYFVDGDSISFCCRQDNLANIPILLPIDKPFYLMRYTGLCQRVLGMTVSDEFIYYDNEDNRNGNNCTGAHPFVEGGCRTGDMKIHYCYYDRATHNSSPISISGIIG